jgi:hypothetical protein
MFGCLRVNSGYLHIYVSHVSKLNITRFSYYLHHTHCLRSWYCVVECATDGRCALVVVPYAAVHDAAIGTELLATNTSLAHLYFTVLCPVLWPVGHWICDCIKGTRTCSCIFHDDDGSSNKMHILRGHCYRIDAALIS